MKGFAAPNFFGLVLLLGIILGPQAVPEEKTYDPGPLKSIVTTASLQSGQSLSEMAILFVIVEN